MSRHFFTGTLEKGTSAGRRGRKALGLDQTTWLLKEARLAVCLPHMPSRVSVGIVRLGAVACACLLQAAVAFAADSTPPTGSGFYNDTRTDPPGTPAKLFKCTLTPTALA